MIDRNRYESLADALASVDDLKSVEDALARERIIRQAMAETGEDREIITQMIDAGHAMSEEAVLELTEGEPTTLRDALNRLMDELNGYEEEMGNLRTVADQLSALLAHRWPEDGYRPPDEALGLPELPPKWSAPLSEGAERPPRASGFITLTD